MKGSARLFNLLASLVTGLTVVVCLGMAVIFVNPDVFFNPFKPVDAADVPVLVTVAPLAATDLPPSTPRGPSVATKTRTPVPSATSASGTGLPFPSPVGPTETTTPTQIPTQTSTLRPPAPTATRQSYPGAPTEPPPSTSAYP